jgi:hypothetical protein
VNDISRVVPGAKFFMSTFCIVVCILRLMHIARTSRTSWTRTETLSCWLQEYPDQWEVNSEQGRRFPGRRFPVRKSAILWIFWFVPRNQRLMSLFPSASCSVHSSCPIHDSIILQLHVALCRLGNKKIKGQETESLSSLMCSILEGRAPKYLNGALAPAWKLLRKNPCHIRPSSFLIPSQPQ